jgi:radical SAM-linked protein
MTATKVRLRFAKRGPVRLVSHHDLMRCLERTLRRSEIPMARGQGFNPRPKLVFPLALGLGIEGRREVLELELSEPMEPDEVLRRLVASAPAGFDFLEAEAATGRPSQVQAVRYELEIPADRADFARSAIASFLADAERPYTRHRPDRTVELNLRPFVLEAELNSEGVLCFRLKMTSSGSARPEEVIESLGLRDLLERGVILVRTEVELAPTAPSEAPGPPDPTAAESTSTP